MGRFMGTVLRLSEVMNVIGGSALVLMMLFTVTDVVLRYFGKPILGTYEIVSLAGAVVIGFAIPQTSWENAHVTTDFVVERFSPGVERGFRIVTKSLGIVLFLLLGCNLLQIGLKLHSTGEVTQTLHIPFYPVPFGLGLCCFIQGLVLLCDIAKALVGGVKDE
jgi:TRAP-type C4-dicarboxylate transport system permease small subunit